MLSSVMHDSVKYEQMRRDRYLSKTDAGGFHCPRPVTLVEKREESVHPFGALAKSVNLSLKAFLGRSLPVHERQTLHSL